jgi:hypothetical protein
MTIVYVSLVVNILVAGFWGIILAFRPSANFRIRPFGSDNPGNRILASFYLAITFFSIVAFFKADQDIRLCIFLFAFQIVYKALSTITVRDFKKPVVLSNLAIVILHSFTLNWIFSTLKVTIEN